MWGREGDEKGGGQQDKMRGFHFSSHAKREAEARGTDTQFSGNNFVDGGGGYLLLPR